MHMQNLVLFHQFVFKILSGNKILTITKGQNCVVSLRKLARTNLDLINVNAYAKFGLIPSIRFQDIERKQSRNHGMAESWTSSKQYTSAPSPPLPSPASSFTGSQPSP